MEIYSMSDRKENSSKGKPRLKARGPRPHIWLTGPDPVKHKQYFIWLQQKNQAQFRQEEWNLSFEDWLVLWGDLWPLRGRTKGSYCMTRYDPFGPWDKDNAIVIERRKHSQRCRSERDIYAKLTLERNSKK